MRYRLATRLLIPIGLVLALATSMTGIVFHHLLARSIDGAIAARLQARIAWLAGCLEFEDDELELEFEAEQVRETMGLAESWQIEVLGQEPAVHWSSALPLSTGADTRRQDAVVTFDSGPDVRLVAGTACADDLAPLRRADLILTTLLPLVFLAAMVGIWLIVRRETGPLARMSAAAGAIDPDLRRTPPSFLPAAPVSREIGELGRALDAMLGRLSEGFARERQFSAAAAHELRTPLAQLVTGLEVAVRQDREADAYRKALHGALDDARRLTGLVLAILRLTRNEVPAGGRCTVAEVVAICEAEGIVPVVTRTLPADLRLPGERELWSMIIGNLLDNARRHAGGDAEVALTATHDTVAIAVSDRGAGVPMAERERIFRPLVRLDEARTVAAEGGYGLGLAIVTGAVGALGGTITCADRADGGSGASFTIRLPRPG